MYDVIIVGGGPAGFSAALYSARAKLDTILIEKAIYGGQMITTPAMENYPGFEDSVSGMELANRMENQAKKFGARILNENAIKLYLNGKIKVVKTNESIYESKTVILSMGAFPKELDIPGENKFRGNGVSYCAICDGALFRDMDVAVIGGGDTAAEDALFLTRFCNCVYLVHRRDKLRAVKILQDEILNHKKKRYYGIL